MAEVPLRACEATVFRAMLWAPKTRSADMQQFDQILRRPQVEEIIGLGRSKIYAMIREGHFPRPVRLTEKAVGWRASDVAAWLAARQAA